MHMFDLFPCMDIRYQAKLHNLHNTRRLLITNLHYILDSHNQQLRLHNQQVVVQRKREDLPFQSGVLLQQHQWMRKPSKIRKTPDS